MSDETLEQLRRERRRALAAEAALAAARRQNDVLQLKNTELAGIIDALLVNSRPTRTVPALPDVPESDA
ncbi:hypothetical protein [Frondihabitans cladoniiphilus]|uniref:DUF4315 family protein n=1 Tax=Frondihabitans cladoniiphilus TaxID=715785 RepID=A0ABP8W3T1_9MICO